jgi:FkbM family methyltransferase
MKIVPSLKKIISSSESLALKSLVLATSRLCKAILSKVFPERMVKKHISSYGPFLLDQEFLFSDFSNWSTDHNSGFDKLILQAHFSACTIDIGAHIGLTTLPLSDTMRGRGIVYAFEPSPTNFYFLSRHVSRNQLDNVKLFDVLIGDKCQPSVEFFEHETVSGMNSLADLERKGIWRKITRPMVTFDSIAKEKGILPDLIKIDVEGAEVAVLTGAMEILRNCKPTIFLSVHPRQLKLLGSSAIQLKALIMELNYGIFDVGTGCELDNKSPLEFREYVLTPRTSL